MATELRKPVRRKTAGKDRRGRALIVTLLPGDVIDMREERCRRSFQLPLQTVYTMAVKAAVDAEASRRKAERRAKKEERT